VQKKGVESPEPDGFDDVLRGMTITLDAIYHGSGTKYHRCSAMDNLCEARQFFSWASDYKAKGMQEISSALLAEGWKAFRAYMTCCDSPSCDYCSLQRRAAALVPM
jgi:hypothetical protein